MNIWFIIIAVMVLSFLVQSMLTNRFKKYSEVPTSNGMSGAEIAAKMLRDNGITDVQIVSIDGKLTDHYNPETKTVNLSEAVYHGRNVAAAAVAAHECGHVVQHATGYAPLQLRSALVPAVSFASNIVQWVLLAGILLINAFPMLFWAGVALFALTTFFSFVTLPVEINVRSRSTPASAPSSGWRMPESSLTKPVPWPSTPSSGPPTPTSSRPSVPWPRCSTTSPSATAGVSIS